MKTIIPIIIVVAAIAGITIYSQNNKQPIDDGSLMVKPDDAMMEKDIDGMEKSDEAIMMEGDEDAMMMKTAGSYIEYGNVDISSLEGDIVLNFSAPWCPSCRRLGKNIEKNLDAIPGDLTIIKVDYDSSTDLKQQYGVTRQHTFVQIDNQGNKISLWSGGNTLESIIENIQ